MPSGRAISRITIPTTGNTTIKTTQPRFEPDNLIVCQTLAIAQKSTSCTMTLPALAAFGNVNLERGIVDGVIFNVLGQAFRFKVEVRVACHPAPYENHNEGG